METHGSGCGSDSSFTRLHFFFLPEVNQRISERVLQRHMGEKAHRDETNIGLDEIETLWEGIVQLSIHSIHSFINAMGKKRRRWRK